jgi:nucleoid-associated protein YgaU
MRTDVKLGVVVSMVVVLVAGGYFLFRGKSEAPIAITDGSSPSAAKVAAKPPAGKQPPTGAGRQVSSTKDAASRSGLPINPGPRDVKLATKPADRSPVAPPKERPPATQPISEPIASATAAFPNKPTTTEPKAEPPVSPPATAPAVAERSIERPPAAPPASASPSPAPTGTPDSAFTSRTLMAGNDPPKPTPLTPAESSALGSPTPASPVAASKPQPTASPVDSKSELAKAAVDTHRVQPGDSLASLAQTYYGNAKYAKFLAESNPGIADPAKLALGQTVKIPPLPADIDSKLANAAPAKTTTPATTTTGGKRTYKVKAGDSFYRIAKDQLGNAERWKELLALNKTLVHGDPTALQPGQTLVLPDS